MNLGRFVLACFAVFVFSFCFQLFLNQFLLAPYYSSISHFFRAEPFLGLATLGQFATSILFCVLFLRGYEDGGWIEGAQYGLIIGLLLAVPSATAFAMQPIPATIAMGWIVGALLERAVEGVLVAFVYRPAQQQVDRVEERFAG